MLDVTGVFVEEPPPPHPTSNTDAAINAAMGFPNLTRADYRMW